MTKTEAHQLIKMSLHSIGDKRLYEAVQMALKALAWECAYEKLMNITITEQSEPIEDTTQVEKETT